MLDRWPSESMTLEVSWASEFAISAWLPAFRRSGLQRKQMFIGPTSAPWSGGSEISRSKTF